jgi:leader peptidase (prepilin peptidase) / N-methyltransferase
VNIILAIPLPARLALLFALGAAVAGFINLGVYRLAWRQRLISPWSAPPGGALARTWRDRLPIFGWWLLARESRLLGRGFWIRPMLIELAMGMLFAGLYLWGVEWNAPRWLELNRAPPSPDFLSDNVPLVLHMKYLGHVILISLMLVASLIDVDEKTIPDSITVPGALLGLLLAAVYPWSLPTADEWLLAGKRHIEFLTLTSPNPWPAGLGGLPNLEPLVIGLGCWTLWCAGLLPRRWNTRHGLTTAVRVFFHRLRVERATYWIFAMWLFGGGAIKLMAWLAPAANWAALLTALVGLAAGGGLIWVVRVIGTAVLKREAMGFGDVTLMAMIGAFVGWQAAIMIFFLAPFLGLAIGVVQRIANGEREIPYGPFLCLATVGVMVNWFATWDWARKIFEMGWLVPAVLAVCMVLLAALLLVVRVVGGWLAGPR